MLQNLKGWRTIGIGLLIAIGPSGLQYLAGIDWTKIVGPNLALVVAGLVTVGLRFVTTTPPGKST